MKEKYHAIADVLLNLEMEMRAHSLWVDKAPATEALQCLQPFCVDTLHFNEWLQFVFIPTMKKIVEKGLNLPSSNDIVPMAEVSFKSTSKHTDTVLELLIECEKILTA